MITVKKLVVDYGSVTFSHEVEAVPATSYREGNVTVNNMGSPGSPSSFEASFMLNADLDSGGTGFHNIFHLRVVIPGLPKDTPYSEVESQAFEKLAPMLRAFAQNIEDQQNEAATKDGTDPN